VETTYGEEEVLVWITRELFGSDAVEECGIGNNERFGVCKGLFKDEYI